MATAAEMAQRRQFATDPSQLDAATRNRLRQEQYERDLKPGSVQLEKWARDPSRRDPSGYTKIPTWDGRNTRYAMLGRTDRAKGYRSQDPDGGDEFGGDIEFRTVDGIEQMRTITNPFYGDEKPEGYQTEWSSWRNRYSYRVSEFDQGWENYNKQLEDPRYYRKAAKGKSDAQNASIFTVGRESALGEGGQKAARTATITTTGAASGKAQAAAAQKRKLR